MYAVGIDVSKGKSTVAIANIDGTLVEKVFEIKHNRNEISDLISHLNSYGKENIKIVKKVLEIIAIILIYNIVLVSISSADKINLINIFRI